MGFMSTIKWFLDNIYTNYSHISKESKEISIIIKLASFEIYNLI